MKQKGFTLIELLVVIAVIATISAIAIVGLNRARDQSIASKTMSNLKTIEKALGSLMFEQERSIWWRDTSFGAGADPAISSITGLTTFLTKIPTPDIFGVDDFIYDNDGDVLTPSMQDLNGVNLILNFASSSAGLRDKLFDMMDQSSDYGSGDSDGKLRTNGADIIFYSITPDETEW